MGSIQCEEIHVIFDIIRSASQANKRASMVSRSYNAVTWTCPWLFGRDNLVNTVRLYNIREMCLQVDSRK